MENFRTHVCLSKIGQTCCVKSVVDRFKNLEENPKIELDNTLPLALYYLTLGVRLAIIRYKGENDHELHAEATPDFETDISFSAGAWILADVC